jgi:hypothetical protein
MNVGRTCPAALDELAIQQQQFSAAAPLKDVLRFFKGEVKL